MQGKPTGTASFGGLWVMGFALCNPGACGRSPSSRQHFGSRRQFTLFHGMGQNRIDDRLVLDTGDYPGFAPALRADRYIDIKHPLQALRPGRRKCQQCARTFVSDKDLEISVE